MNTDIKTMTNEQLKAEAKALRGMAYTASQARNAARFGKINRRLDAVWAEQDRRKRRG